MNTLSTPQWISRLCEDIQHGQFSTNLTKERFNDVLKWLLDREFIVGQQISASMLTLYDDDAKARQNTFLALDDYLFVFSNDSPYAHLGLKENTDLASVKIRYRRLIQLYHPDKGLVEANGFSDRAEKINRAYDRIKSGDYDNSAIRPQHSYRHTPRAPITDIPAVNTAYHAQISDKLRWALGSSEKVTITLISLLVLLAFAVLFSVYNNNRDIDYPGYSESLYTDTSDGADEMQATNLPSNDNKAALQSGDQVITSLSDQRADGDTPQQPTPAPADTPGTSDAPGESIDDLLANLNKMPDIPLGPAPTGAENLAETRPGPTVNTDQLEKMVVQTKTESPGPSITKTSASLPVSRKNAGNVVTSVPATAAKSQRSAKPARILAVQASPAAAKTPQGKEKIAQTKPQTSQAPPLSGDEPSHNAAQKSSVPGQAKDLPVSKIKVVKKQIPSPAYTTTSNTKVATATAVVPAKPAIKTASLPASDANRPLSASERKNSMDVLKGYVNGMLKGDVNQTLIFVDEMVQIDGKSTSKQQLEKTYNHWLNDAVSRKYNVKVSKIVAHQGLVRIKGATSIKFKYAKRKSIGYKGVLYFDIDPSVFGGKIVAISRG